ncbi:MAG: hypothetical protein REI78_14705 [Pedobacter sp.]|nr:hypothetical protein [Pedobacter sp.]MDQ8054280.1 hypothetical protein [Pedobacter sp.]
MKIALVTYQDQGKYHTAAANNEDDLLISFLASKGFEVEKAIWNDPNVLWERFDVVIIKSPWDYFNHINEFYVWLDGLGQLNCRVLNPIAVLKWNADKHYLNDIAQAGLKVTPSVFTSQEAQSDLSSYFERFDTEQIIVKPAVSGGSKNTFKVTRTNVDEINVQLMALKQEEDFIIQPFLKEIEDQGEWSFVFFGGKFSHALLKKAKAGDFRVQATFGGTVHPLLPDPELLAQAQDYVDQFAKDCLYSRVDGTIVNQKLMLMELELIEPFLFLETHEHAFENYGKALETILGQA